MQEKRAGSLNIFIVLIESWEIRPGKPASREGRCLTTGGLK